jgi:hypothetical protein
MAAIAVLLLVAAISITMFIRSWRQAGARALTDRMERRIRMQAPPPGDAQDVSWTRGRMAVGARRASPDDKGARQP